MTTSRPRDLETTALGPAEDKDLASAALADEPAEDEPDPEPATVPADGPLEPPFPFKGCVGCCSDPEVACVRVDVRHYVTVEGVALSPEEQVCVDSGQARRLTAAGVATLATEDGPEPAPAAE